ncbi:LysR family transcriptional regulator [Rhodococcus opacus PD630]|uniref:LysR family transcriptional regulator n=2 Tax=Rhodococcus opacus TaxID=37919 RepID=UPI00029CB216|nr:LysR family transcriptional regulator [Rhodococcus opacus]AHK31990.1 putative HTH-type transcriptional regulator [Rhodococcus opacus PD630]EHI45268.1 LysR family transcriptional regulator [Rhodococcus opacus PD630]
MSEGFRPAIDLESLRMLVLVADLGSISAAARAEHISQPSASRRIKGLEGQLGLELIDRRSRGAELTAHGRMVTDWSRGVVDAADTLVIGARALTTRATDNVSIGASLTVAEYLVPTWLAEFRRRGDWPRVQLRVANSQEVIAALRAREIDLGFIESPHVPSDLRSLPVARDRLVLVVSPQHRLACCRRPLSAHELDKLLLASREGGSGTRETLQRAVGASMSPPAIELHSNTAVKVAVSAGEYAAVLSELTVRQELRDGRLIEVPLAGLDLTRSLHAIWRSGTRIRGSVGDFLALAAHRPHPRNRPSDQE